MILPLLSVYFMLPRNIGLSICVLYGRVKKCVTGWNLNPGQLDVNKANKFKCIEI